MVAMLGESGDLIEAAELAVGHPEPRPGDAVAGAREHLRHQATVVGLAVGVGGHGHDQPRRRDQGGQELAAVDLAGGAPRRQQPLGRLLDLLAIEEHDGQSRQAGRQGDGPERGGQQVLQASGGLLEQAEAQLQGDARQLAIERPRLRRHRPVAAGPQQGGARLAAVLQQGVGDQVEEGGEGQDQLEAAAAVAAEDAVEEVGAEAIGPQPQRGLGQREPIEDLARERDRDRLGRRQGDRGGRRRFLIDAHEHGVASMLLWIRKL